MPARKRSIDWERNLQRLERQLPAPIRRLMRELVKNLREAQRQLEAARSEREARWQKLQTQLRRDAARLLRQLEKAVEPPRQKARRARPRKSGRARRSVSTPEASRLGGRLHRAGKRRTLDLRRVRGRRAARRAEHVGRLAVLGEVQAEELRLLVEAQ